MQFRSLAIAAGAASLAQAQGSASPSLALTDPTYAGITAGEPFTITWEGAQGDVSLILLDDANPNDNHPIATIASGVTGTSYVWTPSETLVDMADYAIQIKDSVTSNDGAQFQLVGGATAPASSAATTATSDASSTAPASTSAESTTMSTSTTASTTAAPSTSASSTGFSNSTMTSSKTSSSSPSGTSSGLGSQTSAPSAANTLASPLALIFLTVAALFSLN